MNNKGIIPPPSHGRPTKYDFGRLKEYGDSMFIEADNPNAVRNSAYQYGNYNGFKVATRLADGGIRVYHAGKTEGK